MVDRQRKETTYSYIIMLIADKISYSIKKNNILTNINFDVRPGEFLAIIGPNGAGKSTLLKILCGELKKHSGTVVFNGSDLTTFKPLELAVRRAVLSQSISLALPFKVSEVVMMGRYPHFKNAPSPADHAIVEECLTLTGMQHFNDRNYLTLSGGEKQRVHLARVLAQLQGELDKPNSKILFLDEPVNGLDLKYQQQVMKVAREWKGDAHSVVAVLHDLNLAAHYADRILLLNQGKQEILDIPSKVLTKELIKKVYDVDVRIMDNTNQSNLHIVPSFQNEEGVHDWFSILM
jgi:iron complex transport system ATP-binding protein